MTSVPNTDSHIKYDNCIRKEHGYTSKNFTYYPVVIIGAGESGIATGCRLKKELGFDQFRIFERQSGVGGTWWTNRYPGVVCDIDANFCSFSFCPNLKTNSSPPSGKEILEYLQDVCEQFKIWDKIQLNTDVRKCLWLESDQVWELTLWHLVGGAGDLSEQDRAQKIQDCGREIVYSFEEKVRSKIIVSAAGYLVEPNGLPEGPLGKERFRGQIFHCSRWRYDVDLMDKEVIVVGTGRSATQFVPLLIQDYGAKSVTQIMRSPPWVIPQSTNFSVNSIWNKWSLWLGRHIPGIGKLMLYRMANNGGTDWILSRSSKYSKKKRKSVEAELLAHMKKTVPRKYHEILTPNDDIGCKRLVVDRNWLRSLNDPAFALTTLPLSHIGETDVTLGPGRMYPDPNDTSSKAPNHEVTIPADIIILANGFRANSWLYPLEIIGRKEKRLHDIFHERGGPQMYMGTALDGFPNFFSVLGPNTLNGHTPSALISEDSISLILKFINRLLQNDIAIVEISKEAELKWAKDIQSALKKKEWNPISCNSWCKNYSLWNSTAYPYSHFWFILNSIFPTWSDWDIVYTRKGLVKNIAYKAIQTIALTTTIYGIFLLRTNQASVLVWKNFVRSSFFTGSNILYYMGNRI